MPCAARWRCSRGWPEGNAETPPDKRIEFRIGTNLGDVIAEEHDIFGDGVILPRALKRSPSRAGPASAISCTTRCGISLISRSKKWGSSRSRILLGRFGPTNCAAKLWPACPHQRRRPSPNLAAYCPEFWKSLQKWKRSSLTLSMPGGLPASQGPVKVSYSAEVVAGTRPGLIANSGEANVANAAFIRSTSASDILSKLIREFRAIL